MATYQYKPLPSSSDKRHKYIRLLTIQPGNFEDELVIELSVKRFDGQILRFRGKSASDEDKARYKVPKYEALSYVWGSRENDATVQVRDSSSTRPLHDAFPHPDHDNDGRTLITVTQNLNSALKHLRLSDKPRLMWIDALCIDQSNNDEKGPQVAMMGAIYRLADRVIFWLGPDADSSGHAMKLLNYLGSQIEVDWRSGIISSATGATDRELADNNTQLPFDEKDLLSIYYLLCRAWFDRLWIRQEITLANWKSIVSCGSYSIQWSNFRNAMAGIQQKPYRYFTLYHQLGARRFSLHGFIYQPTDMDLSKLRRYFGQAKCSDERDRIYAVLELLHDNLGIAPDYTKTTIQVYEDACVRYIKAYRDLDILAECRLRTQLLGPSWVPDWSAKANPLSTTYRAFASSYLPAWYEVPEDAEVLRVAGVSVLAVEHLERFQLEGKITMSEIFGEVSTVLTRTMARRELKEDTGGIKALTRTLIGNESAESFQPRIDGVPDLEVFREVVRKFVSQDYVYNAEDFTNGSSSNLALNYISAYCADAQIFTAGGFFGLARGAAQTGDRVCVLFGNSCPMLLRPVSNGKFLVVGECFMHNLSEGEALLGNLPGNIQVVLVTQPNGEDRWGFKDSSSGDIFYEDPRLLSLPIDHAQYRRSVQQRDPLLFHTSPEDFRRPGFNIEFFDLI